MTTSSLTPALVTVIGFALFLNACPSPEPSAGAHPTSEVGCPDPALPAVLEPFHMVSSSLKVSVAPFALPSSLAWSVSAPRDVLRVASGGFVVFGDGPVADTAGVGRFDAKGMAVWDYVTAPLPKSRFAIVTATGGVVIIAADTPPAPADASAVWLSEDGTLTSVMKLSNIDHVTAAATAPDGTLIIGDRRALYRWRMNATAPEQSIVVAPAAADVPCTNNSVPCSEVWVRGIDVRADNSIVVTYRIGNQGLVSAFDTDGHELWQAGIGASYKNDSLRPLVAQNGQVFVVAHTVFDGDWGSILAFAADGHSTGGAAWAFTDGRCDKALLRAAVVEDDGALDVLLDRLLSLGADKPESSSWLGQFSPGFEPGVAIPIAVQMPGPGTAVLVAPKCLAWMIPGQLVRVSLAQGACP